MENDLETEYILTAVKCEVAQISASSDADGVCHLPHHWQQTTGNLRHYYRVLYFVDRASRYKFLLMTNLTHFFVYLFNLSTCFEHHNAHHQEIKLSETAHSPSKHKDKHGFIISQCKHTEL